MRVMACKRDVVFSKISDRGKVFNGLDRTVPNRRSSLDCCISKLNGRFLEITPLTFCLTDHQGCHGKGKELQPMRLPQVHPLEVYKQIH